MTTYLLGAFLLFGFLFLVTTTTITNLKLKEQQVEKNYKESLKYEEGLKSVINARGNYVKIYAKYPANIDELISLGFLSTEFKNAEYSKDISLDTTGNIVVSNRDIGNSLKNLLLVSNKEALKTEKNLANTEALIEQKRRFNNLKSNETSVVIGNEVNLNKSSNSYSNSSLNSSKTTETLKGW